MGMETRGRVRKLARLYKIENESQQIMEVAKRDYECKQGDYDEVRRQIDVLELELEGGAAVHTAALETVLPVDKELERLSRLLPVAHDVVIMPLQAFEAGCIAGKYKDDEGQGVWATADHYEGCTAPVRIWPSKIEDEIRTRPTWATHVVWWASAIPT